MASEYVLRIPRSDVEAEYVLVHVSRTGSELFDLKLVATEGTTPYLATGILVPISSD